MHSLPFRVTRVSSTLPMSRLFPLTNTRVPPAIGPNAGNILVILAFVTVNGNPIANGLLSPRISVTVMLNSTGSEVARFPKLGVLQTILWPGM